MPAPVYRRFFRGHGLKNLERNILGFSGIAPVRATLIGMIEKGGPAAHEKWLARLRAFGAAGRRGSSLEASIVQPRRSTVAVLELRINASFAAVD